MGEIAKKGRGHSVIKIGSRISVPNDYFENCTREEKYLGTVIKFAGVENEFITVQWSINGLMSLFEFSDVSLGANSELKSKFQIRITLAADYVSDEEKDNNENDDHDGEQDVDLSVDNVPTKLPIRKTES